MMRMEKLDLKKELKQFYAPSAKQPMIVDVPALNYVMIDGQVEPGQTIENSPEFQQVMQALYGASYTLKFNSKLRKENPIDYGVMGLEGLWWSEAGEFDISKQEGWRYTLMMLQPEHITPAMFAEALQQLCKKKPSPALDRLRFERFHEGLSVQIMHIGPYAAEPATLARMHAYAQEQGYHLRGKHHEIYLGDPRKGDPDKMKTVLRQPVEKTA
jgi:hypothetical protein